MPETIDTQPTNTDSAAGDSVGNNVDFDPVCLDVPRIYDSCGSKDCLRDLTVFFTEENTAAIDAASAVRVTKVSVITATLDVDSVAFQRGYYSVDETFYFLCCCEVYGAAGGVPATVTGLAVYTKRVVLYGSDGCVKRFSSGEPIVIDPVELDCCTGYSGSLPTATIQVSSPMALASELVPVTTPSIVPFVPAEIVELLGGALTSPVCQQVNTTIGIFSITALSRDVQLMLPSYDFCLPRKECDDSEDDPCEAFNRIDFPADSFFPPSAQNSDVSDNPFDWHCG